MRDQHLMRVYVVFQGYDLNIQHINCKDNILADALSGGLKLVF